jgi:hypothetical protein
VWLLDPEVWALLFATALASLALVLLLEMLPGRPSIFLIALIIAVATVVSFMIWGARRPLPSSVRPFVGLTAGQSLGNLRRPSATILWPAARCGPFARRVSSMAGVAPKFFKLALHQGEPVLLGLGAR